MTEVLTVQDAAKRAKLSGKTIRRALNAGDLAGSWHGNTWRIFADDLEAWMRSRQPGGHSPDHSQPRRRSSAPPRQRGSLRQLEAIEGGRFP